MHHTRAEAAFTIFVAGIVGIVLTSLAIGEHTDFWVGMIFFGFAAMVAGLAFAAGYLVAPD